MSSATTAIATLESMTVDQRIAEVAKDVLSRTDRYKDIGGYELAELLDLGDPYHPDEGDWDVVRYVPFRSAESVLEEFGADDTLELLEETLSPKRLEQLSEAIEGLDDDKSALKLFSANEQRAMERAYQKSCADSEYEWQVAYYEVRSAHDKLLMFEVSTEGGEVSKHIRTPYDRRDGKFTDLTGSLILSGKPLAAFPFTGQS
jgi:hypothetical protein